VNFTPNDLQNVEIKKAIFGGYNEDVVNEMIDKVVEDYNIYLHENIELKDKIAVLNEGIHHYKNIEESLQNTLIMAQQTSEDVKRNASDKAINIIKEAEIKALQLIKEANEEVARVKYEFEETKKNLFLYKMKAESMLSSQLELIKQVVYEA
jgi:cell division initiation protein